MGIVSGSGGDLGWWGREREREVGRCRGLGEYRQRRIE